MRKRNVKSSHNGDGLNIAFFYEYDIFIILYSLDHAKLYILRFINLPT